MYKLPVEADLLAEDEGGGGEERGDQPDAQQRAQGEAAAALPSQGGHDDLRHRFLNLILLGAIGRCSAKVLFRGSLSQ